MKIADPSNGNVGWVKSSELNNGNSTQALFTFTQSYINNNNKSPMTYRIIQYGEPTKLSSEQAQLIIKQMEMRQRSIQKSMQNMMHDMDQLFYDDRYFMNQNFPFLIPMVVMPVQNATDTNPKVHSTFSNQQQPTSNNKK